MRAPSGNPPDRVADRVSWRTISGPLFRKYVALFVAVVCVALITNGVFEIWFSYQEHKAALIRIQREQAEAAAAKIGQFIKEIEEPGRLDDATAVVGRHARAAPLRRAAAAAAGAGDHRACPARRQGKEQLRVSRLAMDVVGSRHRFLQGPEVHRGGGEEGLLRPGLFPPRIRALHDAGAGRHAARRRRQRRRGQSQADLGRGLADQGRRARPGLS